VSLSYVDDEEAGSRIPAGTEERIAHYTVTGVVDAVADEQYQALGDPKVKLVFEMDKHGLLRLLKAHAEFQETVIEQVEKRVPVNTTDEDSEEDDAADATASEETSSEEDGSDAADDSDTSQDTDSENAASDDEDEDAAYSEGDESSDAEEKEASSKKKKKKKKKKQQYTTILVDEEKVVKHKIPLEVTLVPLENPKVRNLDEAELLVSKALYDRLNKEEKAARDLENARNALETYLYEARYTLAGTKGLDQVLSEEETEELRDELDDSLYWLEDDDTGMKASIHQVRARKTETKDKLDAILFRLSELEKRPKAVEAARAVLASTEAKIAEWTVTKPQITEEEYEDLRAKIGRVTTFLDESEEAQSQLSNFVPPTFSSDEVAKSLKPVKAFVERLMKKPAPIPVVEEKEDEANDEKDTSSDQEETGDSAEDTADESTDDSASDDADQSEEADDSETADSTGHEDL